MLTPDKLIERANEIYSERKGRAAVVKSDQIHALATAMAEAVNKEIETLREELQRKPEPGSRFVVVYDEE